MPYLLRWRSLIRRMHVGQKRSIRAAVHLSPPPQGKADGITPEPFEMDMAEGRRVIAERLAPDRHRLRPHVPCRGKNG